MGLHCLWQKVYNLGVSLDTQLLIVHLVAPVLRPEVLLIIIHVLVTSWLDYYSMLYISSFANRRRGERGWFCVWVNKHMHAFVQVAGTHDTHTNGAALPVCCACKWNCMYLHGLPHHFHSLVLNRPRPSSELQPGGWGPLLYMGLLLKSI